MESLKAHAARGNRAAGLRSMNLIVRYDELRSQTIDDEKLLTEWRAYCKHHGFATTHHAIDFFA